MLTNENMNDQDVEKLLENLNAPEPERAMSSAPEGEVSREAPVEQPQQPSWDPKPWEFDWNGKKIAPDHPDKLKKWASQGYDYAQKMESFKQKQAEVDRIKNEYSKYKTIDDYVKQDPKWWEHVEESYNNRLASEDPIVQRVNGMLQEKLAPFEQLIAQKQEQETQAKIQKEDETLQGEIKSIRERYKDLDFDTPDAEGKSLEYKILEHGSRHGFPSFKGAFLDFYHDQLEKMWESRGREAISKDSEKRQKLGLSSTNATPKRKSTDDFDIRGKSYNQILDEIVQSLN